MALLTDITSATDRALHPGQHNEVNQAVLDLQETVDGDGGLAERVTELEELPSLTPRVEDLEALNTRTMVIIEVGSVGADTEVEVNQVVPPSYVIHAIQVTSAGYGRVRLYVNDTFRDADAARPVETPPTADLGLILEFAAEDTDIHFLSPMVIAAHYLTGSTDPDQARLLVHNTSGATVGAQVILYIVPLEATP
jgi:hypothetical protein